VASLPATALDLLTSRHSVGPKHLSAPGPSPEQLQTAFTAALRAPDHRKRIPFVSSSCAATALNGWVNCFDYGRRCGKSGEELAMERTRAVQAPVFIAIVARIDPAADVPAHEQWATVGGALTNVLNALHFMGFGAKMLSGRRAADPQIAQAFCRGGETLVGWISTGTSKTTPSPRMSDDVVRIVSDF